MTSRLSQKKRYEPRLLLMINDDVAATQTSRLDSLQIMRALAATLVCVGHIAFERGRKDPNMLWLYDAFPWGAGVDIFFVISGFIMIWTFGHKFNVPDAPQDFIRRRLGRIVPSYWFFSALTVVATVYMPSRLDSTSFQPIHALLSFLFIPHLDPEGDLRPILNLGWTLVYEMYFYVIFASCLNFEKRIGIFLVISAILVTPVIGLMLPPLSAGAIFLSNSIVLEFALGILLALSLNRLGITFFWLLCWIAIMSIVLVIGHHTYFADSRFVDRGLPAAMLVAIAVYFVRIRPNIAILKLILVGDASYALYLSHPFIIEAMKIIWERAAVDHIAPLSVSSTGFAIVTIAACLTFSIIFYNKFERPITKSLSSRRFRIRSVVTSN